MGLPILVRRHLCIETARRSTPFPPSCDFWHRQKFIKSLQWCHNGRDGISNHQPYHCLLNRLLDQRKHQSSASLAFVRGIHRWPVNSPHKWPVTRKMLPYDDINMWSRDRYLQTTVFKCIFNENVWISIDISLQFDPKGRIDNNPALVQIMAWRWPGFQ